MMRHYEIIFLIHPDRSNQVDSMIERYRNLIIKNSGAVHRLENWGRRHLAYPIAKVHKAHYILMNIECDSKTLEELKGMFRFNDAVMRNLIVQTKEAMKESSVMMQYEDKEKINKDSYRQDNHKNVNTRTAQEQYSKINDRGNEND